MEKSDGNRFVPRKEFDAFKKSDAILCESYRGALEDKINGMEKSIISTVKLTGAIVSLVISIVLLGLHFFG